SRLKDSGSDPYLYQQKGTGHFCANVLSYAQDLPVPEFVTIVTLLSGGMLAHKETSDNFRLITRVLTHTGQEGRQYGT
ncbi:unnamed protein product, partial [Effrenium voratum]